MCLEQQNDLHRIANCIISQSGNGPIERFHHGLRDSLCGASVRNHRRFRSVDAFGVRRTRESP